MLTAGMSPSLVVWSAFIALVFILLALDLGVVHRREGVMSTTAAFRSTAVWIGLGSAFSIVIYFLYESEWARAISPHSSGGRKAVIEYFTGYLIEKLLSLDNIFVISLILNTFRVPASAQHRVLYWGILGALVLRGIMIGAGTAAIEQISWVIYPLGLVLLVSGAKMLWSSQESEPPDVARNPLVRLTRFFLPVGDNAEDGRFFTRVNGQFAVTPVFLALVAVETTDVVFAIDSVPAVLAVTQDSFLVFSSNIFAILGLRSLFFALESTLGKFRFLKHALAVILGFVGIKIMLSHHVHIAPLPSLAVIASLLMIAVIFSLVVERREKAQRDEQERASVRGPEEAHVDGQPG